VVLAAEAAYLPPDLVPALPAQPLGEDPHMRVVAHPVRPARIADYVVVEIGLNLPALRARIIGEDLATVQPLLLGGQGRIDDGPGKAITRQHPCRLDHRR